MKKTTFWALFATVLMSMQVWAQSSPPTGAKYITVNIANSQLKLCFAGSIDNTDVWVETSPGTFEYKTIGTDWCDYQTYTITGGVAKVYGDITGFNCGDYEVNENNEVTSLDLSNNTSLTDLICDYNQLTSLDVSGLTSLKKLDCRYNQLTSLDVSGLSSLKRLICIYNQLTSLNVSGLSNLEGLSCKNNQLSSLDVSGLSSLRLLSCRNNQLSSLDVSNLSNLTELYCENDNFTTQAIDDIYCSLPNREGQEEGCIYPILNDTSSNYAKVMATNKQNALNKNWKVRYHENDNDIPVTTGTYACAVPLTPPASTPYISMTVTENVTIQIDMKASHANTSVWVETSEGSYTPVLVDTVWTGFVNYTVQGTSIKVYGNLKGFDCSQNNTKLTALSFSEGLSNLQYLSCYNNNFSTEAIDDIYCSLLNRAGETTGIIEPIFNAYSSNSATVMATNKQNALNRNWKVKYHENDIDIPATTGTYACAGSIPPPGTPYFSMTVTENATIEIGMKATEDATPVWVETSEGNYTPVTVGTVWTDYVNYTAQGTSIKVYGNLKNFGCSANDTKLIALSFSEGLSNLERLYCQGNQLSSLDVSGLSGLTTLYCYSNSLSSLNVSGLSSLENLDCYNNQLSSLDVSGLSDLEILYCYDNQLDSLDVSDLSNLRELSCGINHLSNLDVSALSSLELLYCYDNQLDSLDVSDLSNLRELSCSTNQLSNLDVSALSSLELLYCNFNQLTSLDVSALSNLKGLRCRNNQLSSLDVSSLSSLEDLSCRNNQLSSLDVSNLSNLTELYCENDNFTTQAIDDIYCSLPDREGEEEGYIYPILNDTSSNYAKVMATNKLNALNKNWKVRYHENGTDIPATGSYVCVSTPPPPAGTKYITVNIANSQLKLCFAGSTDNTDVWVETSHGNFEHKTIGTDWCNYKTYTITGGEAKVYGDITGFNCGDYEVNEDNEVTSLDLSNNTLLTDLICDYNQLTSLDVSGLTSLKELDCRYNQLTSLDVSGLSSLKGLICIDNQLTSLNVSGLSNLEGLRCKNNQLSSLDVSGLSSLRVLSCRNNQLSSLDVSSLSNLTKLYCENDNFTTQAIDDIYCSLPNREGQEEGYIYPILNDTSSNYAKVMATNKQNALNKNWKVRYQENDTDIPTTSGAYACAGSIPPAGTPYFSMTVTENATIQIDMQGDQSNTSVWVETSEGNYTPVTVGTVWTGFVNYTAQGTSIKVYGDLNGFDCSGNDAKLTALSLIGDLSNLRYLYCQNNNFSTQAIDDIYCSLPYIEGEVASNIYPIFNSSSSDSAIVMATNKQNALAKNWKVRYSEDNAYIPATSGTYSCATAGSSPPFGAPYISMTVTNNATIQIDMLGGQSNTSVWVETSEGNYTPVTVGTYWTSFVNYTAQGTSIKVYGNLRGFDCSENDTKLTALNLIGDLSNLRYLYCQNNNFSTQAIDDIYCSLPNIEGGEEGYIFPIFNSSSSNYATVMATNKQNALAKNWEVRYSENDSDIPATSGSYVCAPPAESKYITVNIANSELTLDLAGSTDSTDVWVETSPGTFEYKTIGTIFCGYQTYTITGGVAKVYGDIKKFDCGYEDDNENNEVTNLDFSNDTLLTKLFCSYNQLTSFDVSALSNLNFLDCSYNQLTSLDVSGLSNLDRLYCHDNNLTTLDISGSSNLNKLYCYKNNFNTQAIDDIYCSLPNIEEGEEGYIYLILNDTSSNYATVMATNKQNALAKNWKVRYYENGTDIPQTSGTYACVTGISDIKTNSFVVYPNPTDHTVNVKLNNIVSNPTVSITDLTGKVLYSTNAVNNTISINVSDFSKGFYLVKVGNNVRKLIKN